MDKQTIIRRQNRVEQLFEKEGNRYWFIAAKMVDARNADDVVVIARTRAHYSVISLQDEAAMETWVQRIVINVSLQYRRREKKRAKEFSIHDERFEYLADPQDHVVKVFDGYLANLSEKTLRKLKPEGYQMLRMVFEGFTLTEIGEELNLSLGQVRYRLDRIYKDLGSCSHQGIIEIDDETKGEGR